VSDASRPKWHRHELTYCANVHPGETFDEVRRVISYSVNGVRERRRIASMGTGLWLSQSVAAELREISRQGLEFIDLLNRCRLELFTLNGFPYGGFHSISLKERVYLPAWTEPARYDYTLDLAQLLAACLPEWQSEATISTVPLGYRYGWTIEQTRKAADTLCRLAAALERLHEVSGKRIRVCLEMEPDAALESTDEAIVFFQRDLPEAAQRARLEPELIREYLGVCLDVCHQAVMFEDVAASLARLRNAGIEIGKIQLSSALEVIDPSDPEVRQVLQGFAEPRYLHQVRSQLGDGRVIGARDLPIVLNDSAWATHAPWRIHFHVPLQISGFGNGALGTTRDQIGKVFDFLRNTSDSKPHLEIETYTWHVLPEELRPQTEDGLLTSLVQEIQWVEAEMNERELLHGSECDQEISM
jgi:sugar phosphate isomerase/epimerase